MMNRSLALLAVVSVAAVPVLACAAEPIELRFGFPAPATSFVNTKGMTPWIEEVEKASGGSLKIKLFPGPTLGDFRAIYDRTLDGVADVSFGIFGPLGGQFRQTSVSSLPFEARNTSEAALAQWRLYAEGVIAKEFEKVKVLALFNFPSGGIHTKAPVVGLDIKGRKFSVSTREMAQLVGGLGGVPISQSPPDVYESIGRGTTEGAIIAWTAVQTFKLHEVAKYHLEAPLGMSPAYVFMNKAAYARLPAGARAAIDRHSGEPFVRRLAVVMDQEDGQIARDVAAMPGHVVAQLPEDQYDTWRARIKQLVDTWVAETPDGANVLAAFRREVAKIRKGS
jgi:TRAP-type C4-dicarboxylate transport system substrate-binding protein